MNDRYYPLFFKGDMLQVLVIGGGTVALRKVTTLLNAGAKISLVSPEVVPALADLIAENGISWTREKYDPRHIAKVQLVIGATDDGPTNKRIAFDAGEKGIPVNIVDNPALSSVIMPSVIDQAPLAIAVSTSGSAPELARTIKTAIEEFIPATYPILLDELKTLRPRIKKLVTTEKRRFWQQVTELVRARFNGNASALAVCLRDLLASCESAAASDAAAIPESKRSGKVFLVGAGPGDPGLLTLKGRDCLRMADVVIYDYLAEESLLSHAPESCERIFVGKSASRHTKEQAAINALMVEKAELGNIVVRLKGGDPFIFGRGGEECDVLRKAKVPYEVVPGVTSGTAAPAYAGIPLTYRGIASTVTFVTGHREKADASPKIRWEHLAKGADTLVFFMGVTNLPQIVETLLTQGKSPDTPACVIQWGTRSCQKTVASTLSGIVKTVKENSIHAPAIVVIGEVVRLRETLQWFEQKSGPDI
jgi:uroporphyrin-III C-methyltransferase/precorrin-2 dehydrogenase/sirohydrochlorin ferrochelatase